MKRLKQKHINNLYTVSKNKCDNIKVFYYNDSENIVYLYLDSIDDAFIFGEDNEYCLIEDLTDESILELYKMKYIKSIEKISKKYFDKKLKRKINENISNK